MLKQSDVPKIYADTQRPCPWAAGDPLSWPVIYRSDRGDVWQTGPDRFVVLSALNYQHEFGTLAAAVTLIARHQAGA